MGNGTAEEYKKEPLNVKIKSDSLLNKMLEDDPELIKYDESLIFEIGKLEVLQACVKELNSRGWSVRTAFQHEQFISGA